MIKALVIGLALALGLIAASSGSSSPTAQARSIPWDCSDWQAFAHSDRTTSILESLAANRGKTLYCGIDQSDTFTKAETWEAGRDRNERDDTVYQGEQGRFRGFIAAQEGWLTEGESGVTGQSIDRIFEFPREEKKRRRRDPRLPLRYGREYPQSTLSVPGLTANAHRTNPTTEPAGPTTGYLVPDFSPTREYNYIRGPRSTWNGIVRAFGPQGDADTNANAATAQTSARNAWAVTDDQAAEWALNGNEETTPATLEVPGGATEECMALGWRRATNVRWWWFDNDGDGNADLTLGPDEDTRPTHVRYRAYGQIFYEATCKK